jgi:hypothetical protein
MTYNAGLRLLDDLAPWKAVLGSKADAQVLAEAFGWNVAPCPPRGGLAACFKRALHEGAQHALVMQRGIVASGTGHALTAAQEVSKIMKGPYDAISLGPCIDPEEDRNIERAEAWGQCSRFARVPTYTYIFETDCTCIGITLYSKAFMQQYVQRPQKPSRIFAVVPELFLDGPNPRVRRRPQEARYDPNGRVVMLRRGTIEHHGSLVLVAAALGVILMMTRQKN